MPAAFSPEPIGLIGAGLMGTALAERLLAAGLPVLVWDQVPSRVAALASLGARVGTICALIYAFGIIAIWWAPDTANFLSD